MFTKLFLILSLTLSAAVAATAQAEDKVRIIVISDINGRYGSDAYHARVSAAVKHIIRLSPDLVISTGDMVAGQRPRPHLSQNELNSMWESFHRVVRNPIETAGIPLLMTPGNHDASAYPGYELERQTYSRYLNEHPLSLAPTASHDFPFSYATRYRGLLLISLDATASGPLPEAQRDWLKNQLGKAGEASPALLYGHLPLQAIAIGRERDVINDPELERLMSEGDVLGYLSGHHHAYYPGVRAGLRMLSMANLGGNQRPLVGTDIRTGYGFAMLEIGSGGELDIRAYRGPDFNEIIDHQRLPEQLGTGTKRLQRIDLAPLAAAE